MIQKYYVHSTDKITMLVGESKDLDLTLSEASVSQYIVSSIDDNTIASLEGKEVTALKAGTTTVTSILNDNNVKTTTIVVCDVNVTEEENETKADLSNEVESIVKAIIAGDELENLTDEQIEEIQDAINAGAVIEVAVISEEVPEEEIQEDSEKVKALVGKASKVAVYYNIEITLKDSNTGAGIVNLTNLSDKVKITVNVPENLPKVSEGFTRVFKVVKVHDGKAEVLKTENNGDGTLSFESSEFSTYAVTYVDEPTTTTDDEETPVEENKEETKDEDKETTTPKTGDNIVVAGLVFIIATLGLVVVKKIRK